MRRSTRALLLVSLAAVAGCTGGDAVPKRRTLIDSRDTYDPRSLDPALSTDVPTGRAVSYVFDGLTRFTPDARVEPGLASRWDVSDDGRTYTFHLRTGIKFHDGSPFVARLVKHSWERALDPETKGGRAEPLMPIKGASDITAGRTKDLAGVVVSDDSTVVITLDQPLAFFPKLLAMPVASIVPGSTSGEFGQHPIGTGPWKFVEWKRDDYLLFARNDAYFGGVPAAESLRARIIPEPSTAVAEFENGNVDILTVPLGETQQWDRQTDEKKAMLQTAPALILYYVAINTTRGALSDSLVRQALNYAVDTRTILQSQLSGRGTLARGVVPHVLDPLDSLRTPYAFDPPKARQLLAQAGHATDLKLELYCSQDQTIKRLAESVQSYLQAVGIQTTLVQRDASSAREAARNGQADLILKTWYADYPDPDSFLFPLLHSSSKGAGGNVSFWANARFDSLVVAARHERDDARRAAESRSADSLAYAAAPMIYLFFYDELYAIQPWVQDFRVPTIFNGQRWTDVRKASPGSDGR